MRIKRLVAAAATVAVGALILSGCAAPQSEIVEGLSLSVAWNQPFYSANGFTSFGNATANNNINYATYAGFNYYDNTPKLVKDTSFGTYEKISDDPLVVKYTIADGVKWSDGTAVDAADMLMEWVAQWAAPEKTLIAGTSTESVRETVRLTNAAAEMGRSALDRPPTRRRMPASICTAGA